MRCPEAAPLSVVAERSRSLDGSAGLLEPARGRPPSCEQAVTTPAPDLQRPETAPATEQSGRIDARPIAVRTPTGPDGRDFADTAPRTMKRLQPLERKSLK